MPPFASHFDFEFLFFLRCLAAKANKAKSKQIILIKVPKKQHLAFESEWMMARLVFYFKNCPEMSARQLTSLAWINTSLNPCDGYHLWYRRVRQ